MDRPNLLGNHCRLCSVLYPGLSEHFWEVNHEAKITEATRTETAKTAELQSIETKNQEMDMHQPAKQYSAQVYRLRGI